MSDYPVGYKKPPKHTRWKKGQCGNRTGRVKGQRNLKTDLIEELAEVVQLSEGGAPKRLTKQRVFVKGLIARAIKGDARAAGLALNLMLKLIDPEPETEIQKPLSKDDEALVEAFLNRFKPMKGVSDDTPENL